MPFWCVRILSPWRRYIISTLHQIFKQSRPLVTIKPQWYYSTFERGLDNVLVHSQIFIHYCYLDCTHVGGDFRHRLPGRRLLNDDAISISSESSLLSGPHSNGGQTTHMLRRRKLGRIHSDIGAGILTH